MTKREFTAIVLKLTGVFVLVRYLGYLPMVLSPLTVIRFGESNTFSTWLVGVGSIVPPLLYLAACILIIIKSEKIAARLIPEDGKFRVGFNLSREDVLTIAFCCIGLVFFVGSIPRLVQAFSSLVLTRSTMSQSGHSRPWGVYATLASHLVQAIIGLALFLQARGMSGLWHKLRDYKGI